MRSATDAKKNQTADVIFSMPWRVQSVSPMAPYQFAITFVDGTCGVVDMRALILGGNPGVFEALKDEASFSKVYVSLGAPSWPGDLDLAPDALYGDVKKNGIAYVR